MTNGLIVVMNGLDIIGIESNFGLTKKRKKMSKNPLAGVIFMALLLLGLTAVVIILSNKIKYGDTIKETPTTIYTQKDIYYIYKDSITTESGVVITDFKTAFIELQTACDLH